jgi:NAD(P)-dependent dehydrogenase (short-subunit alcohol dehydrogenase family)
VSLAGFAGRAAVVTGAASGIGRALALALAAEGARVALADVDAVALEEARAAAAARGAEALAVPTDVSDPAAVERLAARTAERFGPVHLLCNNAGVITWGPLAAATRRDWEWVLGVNLWGVVHGLLAFLPGMLAHGQGGHVVNTASMAGLVATAGLGVYNASKYAVVGLSETLARELRPHGIGVTVVCPMGVATRIEEAARARPPALRNARGGPAAAPVPLDGPVLTPETVARATLDAVRAGELYVLTHAEGREPLRRRFERLDRAFRRAPRV